MLYSYFHLLGLVAILAKGVEGYSQTITVGGQTFQWSYRSPINGYNCIRILEAAEPSHTTWGDNYFCWKPTEKNAVYPGFKWSSAGPIPGMTCTQILETADPHTWSDNYLCVPCDSPFKLSWSSHNPIPGKKCVQWLEPSDCAGTWFDNWLCIDYVKRKASPAVWPDDFKWSSAGIPKGYKCVQIVEPAEPAHTTWRDNYFCWKCGVKDPGFKWSNAGVIPNMKCTLILETADPHTWRDNYLCVPKSSKLNLKWHSAGPIAGKKCIQWHEGSDQAGTWHDNYLCN